METPQLRRRHASAQLAVAGDSAAALRRGAETQGQTEDKTATGEAWNRGSRRGHEEQGIRYGQAGDTLGFLRSPLSWKVRAET